MTHVLVVDDSTVTRQAVGAALRHAHFEPVLARSAKEARGKMADHRIDAILLDIQMPELDGFGFSRELKANPTTAAIPIVALTARSLEVDRQMALDAGCTDLWVKPLRMFDLERRLRDIVTESRAAVEGSP